MKVILLIATLFTLYGCSTEPSQENVQWIAKNVTVEEVPADDETEVENIDVRVLNTINLDKTTINENTKLNTKLELTMEDGTKQSIIYDNQIKNFMDELPVQIGDKYSGMYEAHEQITFVANKLDTRTNEVIDKKAIVSKEFSSDIEEGTILQGNSAKPRSITNESFTQPEIKDEYTTTDKSRKETLNLIVNTKERKVETVMRFDPALEMTRAMPTTRIVTSKVVIQINPDGSYRISD